jgi:anti-sigma regulatory factor (Ser/Thr protein kinase)
LANGIAAIGAELSGDRSAAAAIQVEVDGTARDLNPMVREEAYRIAGEALRNAFKHAQARQIIVTIHYEARQLRLTIRDDGTGMDEETMRWQQRPGHFGLSGMRERAEIVRGRIEVRSTLGVGTEVEMRVPGAIAYRTPERVWWLRVFEGRGTRAHTDSGPMNPPIPSRVLPVCWRNPRLFIHGSAERAMGELPLLPDDGVCADWSRRDPALA